MGVSMQELAWIISLVGMLIVLVVFLLVVRGASTAGDGTAPAAAGRIRASVFWVLAAIMVIASIAALRALPYGAAAAGAAESVNVTVTGTQWRFAVEPGRARVGQRVVFQVSSQDVNHGIGVYDSGLRLLGQTQAMPGYINRLSLTFSEPGTYKLLCLEYCGVAHHEMTAEFVVEAR